MGLALKETKNVATIRAKQSYSNNKAAALTITSNTHGYLASWHSFIPISQRRKLRLKGQVICQISCLFDT